MIGLHGAFVSANRITGIKYFENQQLLSYNRTAKWVLTLVEFIATIYKNFYVKCYILSKSRNENILYEN